MPQNSLLYFSLSFYGGTGVWISVKDKISFVDLNALFIDNSRVSVEVPYFLLNPTVFIRSKR